MKHLLIAFVILALCLSFCIWSCLYVRAAVAPVLDALQLAQVHALNGSFSDARSAVERADRLWRGEEPLFGILLRHDETDEVLCSFAALREYAETRDTDEFSAGCAELSVRLQHLRSMQLPSVSGIF